MATKKRWKWAMSLSLILALLVGLNGSVFAFHDVTDPDDKAKITVLKEEGVVSGFDDGSFAPSQPMTYAQAVALIVKGFQLSADPKNPVNNPFSHVGKDDWFADAFLTAYSNGIEIPSDVKPNGTITREQFAHLLAQAIDLTGDYAVIEMWIIIADEEDVDPAYMNSIQRLLLMRIANLDGDQKFRPKDPITRREAAMLLYEAREFVKKVPPIDKMPDGEVTLTTEAVTEEVQKAIVSWGEKPNPGYRVTIDQIVFAENGTAYIYYSLHEPDPNMMYPQVITEAKAHVYLGTEWVPELAPSFGGGSAGSGGDDPVSSSDDGGSASSGGQQGDGNPENRDAAEQPAWQGEDAENQE